MKQQYSLEDCEITICGISLKEWQTGDVIIIHGRRRPRLEQLRRRRREFKARFEQLKIRRRFRKSARQWFDARIAEHLAAIAETWPVYIVELPE